MGRTTSPVDWEGPVSLSRKRKKELRKLQTQANSLWEAQQVLVGEGQQVGALPARVAPPAVEVTAGDDLRGDPRVVEGDEVFLVGGEADQRADVAVYVAGLFAQGSNIARAERFTEPDALEHQTDGAPQGLC